MEGKGREGRMEFFPEAALSSQGSSLPSHDSLKGSLLLMPAVSVGNVGQLAVDLLLQALPLSRIGCLEHPDVLPCAGNDALDPSTSPSLHSPSTSQGRLALPLEVFRNDTGTLAVLQQRSPVAQGRMREFCGDLAEWVRRSGVKGVIVLSGADAGKRTMSQMEGDQSRYFIPDVPEPASVTGPHETPTSATPVTAAHAPPPPPPPPPAAAAAAADAAFQAAGVQALESAVPFHTTVSYPQPQQNGVSDSARGNGEGAQLRGEEEEEEVGEEGDVRFGPGPLEGGQWGQQHRGEWSAAFLRLCYALNASGVPSSVLLTFCSEGDNVREALELATRTRQVLVQWKEEADITSEAPRVASLFDGITGWKTPGSWQHLFGPPPDSSLFG